MWKPIRAILSLNDPDWGRNPEGNGQRPPPRRPGNDGPPDLDELWRDLNRRLSNLFGRSTRGGGGGNGNTPDEPGRGMRGAGTGIGVMLTVAVLLWLASGFYIVQEGQAAAVLQFGEFKYLNDRAGFTWRLPSPIQSHEVVNVQQLRQVEIGYRNNVKNKVLKESLMLTLDQSIVDMQIAVQYRVSDAKAWLFNNNPGGAPEEIIRQTAEVAMREQVGRKGIDQVLYEEKEAIANEGQKLMQGILDRYQSGVTVIDLTIQQAQPPEQVQASFEDANKAAQDRERLINEGRAYANDVIPKARGNAARLLQEAEGYKQRVIATALGDANRFKQIEAEYNKAPQLTRERLYLDAMQQVFTNTSKIYIDSKNPGNLLYLPLDKLTSLAAAGEAARAGAAAPIERAPEPAVETRPRDGLRSRDRDSSR